MISLRLSRFSLTPLFLGLFIFSSCGKSDAPGTRNADSLANEPKAAIDTNTPAKEAVITDSNHFILFRPPVGTSRRYRISIKSNVVMNVTDQLMGGPQGKQTANNTAAFYIREIVRAVNADSTVDVSFYIDSVRVNAQQDTMRIAYSSNNASQKNDVRFSHFQGMIGRELKAKISNHGDPKKIEGVEALVKDMMKTIPDSLQNPRVEQMRGMQVQSVVNQSIIRLMVFLPTRSIGKDSSWSDRVETNLPVTQEIMFPVVVNSKETVRGFEDHNGTIVAILEASTSTKPKKTVIEHGQAKAQLSNFSSEIKGITRVEDNTGLIVHRTLSDKRSYIFTLESKQQPGKIYRMQQNSSEEMLVEALR